MKIKRYNIEYTEFHNESTMWTECDIVENKDGEFVKYEDHLKEIEELEIEIEKLLSVVKIMGYV